MQGQMKKIIVLSMVLGLLIVGWDDSNRICPKD